ncbi:unnamed protein product [Didymodactylos carnosus]|uniref:Uncharacterized protein n=1 Tax=Didymodactylos carnosus TaxID=1234261 RepID=A0A815WSJ7_9BILA|nr:unnamed protein product [Didymodactylos carnosus]CAF1553056.1 unnamed protein product [Didymodactylos carnosus]CAF4208473.1 unnamed protein product [Didymodactylos carnosus]CAF4414156.1 unnamed protein product [Didymodactylos carnosus]
MGVAHARTGEYNEALAHDLNALQYNKSEAKDGLSLILSSIVQTYQELALDYLQQAMAMRLAIMPEDHPDLFTSYQNIGAVYEKVREPVQATVWYKKLETMSARRLPNGHPLPRFCTPQAPLIIRCYVRLEEKHRLFAPRGNHGSQFPESGY